MMGVASVHNADRVLAELCTQTWGGHGFIPLGGTNILLPLDTAISRLVS